MEYFKLGGKGRTVNQRHQVLRFCRFIQGRVEIATTISIVHSLKNESGARYVWIANELKTRCEKEKSGPWPAFDEAKDEALQPTRYCAC
ncbi:hypothetical protein [Paraburkholderia rhizosphaerae]|uniref:hypothetical protein n=1 Tax=Paraburkholderia rhizosphaerae TaxID=480658 RepID=UPI001065A960|nr:hypothetical protein [Paraburkholderia rhizosphaerae]